MEIEFEEKVLIKTEPDIHTDAEESDFDGTNLEGIETQLPMQFLDPLKRLQFLREAGLTGFADFSGLENLDGKPFKCDQCDKSFKRKSHLTRHRILHSGQKPFSCNLCDERFTRSENRARHILQMHQEGSKYQCEVCHRGFNNMQTWTRHLKTHSDDRPFACDICGNRYFRKDKLNAHKLGHIARSEEDRESMRKYACEVCGRKFTRRDHMQRHKVSHTGIKLHECAYCSKRFSRKDNQVKHQSTCFLNKSRRSVVHAQLPSGMDDDEGDSLQIRDVSAMCEKQFQESEMSTIDSIKLERNEESMQINSMAASADPETLPTGSLISSRDGAVEIFLVKKPRRTDAEKESHQEEETDNTLLSAKISRAWEQNSSTMAKNVPSNLSEIEPEEELRLSLPKVDKIVKEDSHELNASVYQKGEAATSLPDEQYLKCGLCDKQFRHKHHLLRHQWVHLGIKPFKCQVCSRAFTRKEHLNRHLTIHNKNTSGERNSFIGNSEPNENDTKSQGCISEESMDKNERIFFRGHENVKTEHTTEEDFEIYDENSGNYVSSLLEISMSSSNPITRLEDRDDPEEESWNTENPDYIHSQLSKSMVAKDDKWNRSESRDFPCDKCDKVFNKQFLLSRHYTLHTGEKRFKCTICDRGFTRMEHQKRHMVTHSNDRKYECEVCDRKFSRTDHLLTHMKSSHTEIKPYRCQHMCGQRFDTFREKSLHSQLRQCVFNCDLCDLMFTTKYELDFHTQSHKEIYQEVDIKPDVEQPHGTNDLLV